MQQQQQQQQQQQLLQLLSLSNPALLMQLNAQNNAFNPLALLHTLQQQAVLSALQQPLPDPRLNYASSVPVPAPQHPTDQFGGTRGGSYRGRGGYRGGRGGYDQGYKRARDDTYQGPGSKRAKISHPAPAPNVVHGASGLRSGQSESGSAAQSPLVELSSNTSPQTTTELAASVSSGNVPSVQHMPAEPDVVALGSDSEEELPLTRINSASASDDSEDGEISSDEGALHVLPGPGSNLQGESHDPVSTEIKKRKRKKKKKKPSKEREVCKYYMNRSCSKGEECSYLHTGLKLDEVCRFYRSGVCRRGDECIYSHGK